MRAFEDNCRTHEILSYPVPGWQTVGRLTSEDQLAPLLIPEINKSSVEFVGGLSRTRVRAGNLYSYVAPVSLVQARADGCASATPRFFHAHDLGDIISIQIFHSSPHKLRATTSLSILTTEKPAIFFNHSKFYRTNRNLHLRLAISGGSHARHERIN